MFISLFIFGLLHCPYMKSRFGGLPSRWHRRSTSFSSSAESMSFSTPEGSRTSLRESVGGAGSFIILAKVPVARASFALWPGWHSISCTHVPIRISVNGMQFPIWEFRSSISYLVAGWAWPRSSQLTAPFHSDFLHCVNKVLGCMAILGGSQ